MSDLNLWGRAELKHVEREGVDAEYRSGHVLLVVNIRSFGQKNLQSQAQN